MRISSRLLGATAVLACLVSSSALLFADEPVKKSVPAVKIIPGRAIAAPAKPAAANPDVPATHEQIAEIKVSSSTGNRLQTLCADPEGRILALVAPPRGYGAALKNATAEVQVFTPTGQPVSIWKVNFHAHSINAGPDGAVFIGGDGRIAKFDKDGKKLAETELQHVAEILKDMTGLRKKAEEQLKAQKESFASSVKQLKDQQKQLEAKKPEELTTLQKRQLDQYKLILKSYEQTEDYYNKQTVEDVIGGITSRLRIINGVAASAKDVFIACGESQGYGYAVWRMGHDFKNPKQVISGLGGCCGQMDIQCCENDLLVAENTKHHFTRYTRDGKALGSYGKRGAETDPTCFGGCCNPMNLRALAGGDIFTAESEGIVKRFSAKGDFLGTVGTTKLTGGCKNVAVAASPDGERVYFCDQPGSRVIVLGKKPAATTEKKSN